MVNSVTCSFDGLVCIRCRRGGFFVLGVQNIRVRTKRRFTVLEATANERVNVGVEDANPSVFELSCKLLAAPHACLTCQASVRREGGEGLDMHNGQTCATFHA